MKFKASSYKLILQHVLINSYYMYQFLKLIRNFISGSPRKFKSYIEFKIFSFKMRKSQKFMKLDNYSSVIVN